MGYSTEFSGYIDIEPALSRKEINYLTKFSETRRMLREKGEYFVDGNGFAGQDRDDDIIEYNSPPSEQPSLWCQWIPTDDGTSIEWNDGEKFHNAAEWMWYLIQNFIKPDPIAKIRFPKEFAFLKGHTCNGEIEAQGEDSEDRWNLKVKDNEVFIEKAHFIFDNPVPIENVPLTMKYCYETNKHSKKCDDCDERFKCYTGEPAPKPSYISGTTFWA